MTPIADDMGVWVTYHHDPTPVVRTIHAEEIDARRQAVDNWHHVAFIPYGASIATSIANQSNDPRNPDQPTTTQGTNQMVYPTDVRYITISHGTTTDGRDARIVASHAHNEDAHPLGASYGYGYLVNDGTYLHRDDVLAIIDHHLLLPDAGADPDEVLAALRDDITARGM